MKKQSPNFIIGVGTGLIVLAAFYGNNLLTILFGSNGVMLIATLIEDSNIKRKVTIIFGILSLTAGVLCVISWRNHGFSLDYSFKNIF